VIWFKVYILLFKKQIEQKRWAYKVCLVVRYCTCMVHFMLPKGGSI